MATTRGTSKAALEAEAKVDDDIKFTFDGTVYSVRKDILQSIDVMEALEQNKSIVFAKNVVGLVQWNKFRSKGRTYDDVNEFVTAMTNALVGAPPGE